MISDERIYEIAAAWEKYTPEEKARIRDQVERLREESNSWGPFYGENCRTYHRKTKLQAESIVEFIIGLDEGESLADSAWPALELAIIEELRNPKALAWDCVSMYLMAAIEDPAIQQNPEAVKVIDSWLTNVDFFGFGHKTAECIAPSEKLISEWVRSSDAAKKASKKNAEPRAWVLTEWQGRPDLGQSKASFARQYVPLVKQRFGVLVTEDTIKRDWLPKSAK